MLLKDLKIEAALLDPHTATELPADKILQMCDDLLEAHREWLQAYP